MNGQINIPQSIINRAFNNRDDILRLNFRKYGEVPGKLHDQLHLKNKQSHIKNLSKSMIQHKRTQSLRDDLIKT